MAQPLLEGNVDNRDALIEQLQEEVRTLTRDLLIAKADAAREKRSNATAVTAVRRQLQPLYQALASLFGELDKFEVVDAAQPTAKHSTVWESWKSTLGGKQAEFIDLLLTHGEMTAAQFKAAAHCAIKTVYDTTFKLNKAGILNKNGGRFSLKEL